MAEVICPRCEEARDSSFDFYWNEEKRHRWCKECLKEYTREWHKKRKDRINELREARAREMRGT